MLVQQDRCQVPESHSFSNQSGSNMAALHRAGCLTRSSGLRALAIVLLLVCAAGQVGRLGFLAPREAKLLEADELKQKIAAIERVRIVKHMAIHTHKAKATAQPSAAATQSPSRFPTPKATVVAHYQFSNKTVADPVDSIAPTPDPQVAAMVSEPCALCLSGLVSHPPFPFPFISFIRTRFTQSWQLHPRWLQTQRGQRQSKERWRG